MDLHKSTLNQERDQFDSKDAPNSLKYSDKSIQSTGQKCEGQYGLANSAGVSKTVDHFPVRMETVLKLVAALVVINVVLVLSMVHLQYRVKDDAVRVSVRSNVDDPTTAGERLDLKTRNSVGSTGVVKLRELPKKPEPTLVRVARSSKVAAKTTTCAGLSIKRVLEDYCTTKSKDKTDSTIQEATFDAVFGKVLDPLLNPIEDPNCVRLEIDKFPESWCKPRTVQYHNKESPVKLFRAVTNQLISFNNATGVFTVLKSGTYIVYGSIPVISNSHNQLLGVYVNNDISMACPSGGYGIVRPDNHGDSRSKRICIMNGVLRLKRDDQLQVKTLVVNLIIHLDKAASISWILIG